MKKQGLRLGLANDILKFIMMLMLLFVPWQLHADIKNGDFSTTKEELAGQGDRIQSLRAWFLPLAKRLQGSIQLQGEISLGIKSGNQPHQEINHSLGEQKRAAQQAQQMAQGQNRGKVDWDQLQKHLKEAQGLTLQSKSNLSKKHLGKALTQSDQVIEQLKKALELLKEDQNKDQKQEQNKDSQDQDQKQQQDQEQKQDQKQQQDQKPQQDQKRQQQEKQSPRSQKADQAQEELKAINQQQEMDKKQRKKQLRIPRQKPVIPVERDW